MTAKIQQLKNKHQQAINIANNKEANFIDARQRRNRYKNKLIGRILNVNQHGADTGARDGSQDGITLSYNLGEEYGGHDGRQQGLDRGTYDGKSRDRQIGYDKGQVDGAYRATQEGPADGKYDGTVQGNKDAASANATADAKKAAKNSDASQVGTNQGKAAGMERAVKTGNTNGTKIGEAQGISFYESKPLKKTTIKGNFVGSFASGVPTFPSEHVGRNFRPYGNYPRLVVKAAYEDGYKHAYFSNIRDAFYNVINRDYTNAFEREEDIAYREAMKLHYPQSEKEGYDQGEIDAFNRDYPAIYQAAFDDYRDRFSSQPNKSSTEYKSTYSSVKSSVYGREYEAIRAKSYRTNEASTFDQNIVEQTEKYRIKRYNQVDKIYKTSAVLKYVKSSITDMGISGVAKLDGVYQPHENIVFDVVMKNYGLVPAKGASVTVNGSTMSLVNIPASAETTIVKAAKGQVSASEGQVDTQSLQVKFSLTKEKKIQGKHFYGISASKLNSLDTKKNIISYPMTITNLNMPKTFFIGQVTSLQTTVSNKSKRNYKGPFKVVLEVENQEVHKLSDFEDPSSIASSGAKTLKKAKVIVKSETAALKSFSFSAKVYKNTVLLGHTQYPYSALAKIKYIAKENATILAFNSEKETYKVKNMISDLGGIKNVSLLDFSLGNANAAIISNGVKNKNIIVFNGDTSRVSRDLRNFVNKGKSNTYFLFGGQSFYKDFTKGNTFIGSKSYPLSLKSIDSPLVLTFSKNKSSEDSSTAIYSDGRNMNNFFTLFESLKLNNTELLQAIKTSMTAEEFLNPSASQILLLQTAYMRSIDEIVKVNQLYKLSGESEEVLKILEENSSLFHIQLMKEIKKFSKDKASLFMFARDYHSIIHYAIKDWNVVEKEIKSSVRKVLFGGFWGSGSFKPIKKSFKVTKKRVKKPYKILKNQIGATAPFNYDD